MNSLITVATYLQPYQAHIAKSFLEENGLSCYLVDEHLVMANPLYSNAIGGIRLQVAAHQAEEARQLIRAREHSLEQGGEEIDWGSVDPSWSEEAREESDSIYSCPKCRCADAHYEAYSRRLIFLSILLLGVPLPFLSRTWICDRCGHRWKNALFRPFGRKSADHA